MICFSCFGLYPLLENEGMISSRQFLPCIKCKGHRELPIGGRTKRERFESSAISIGDRRLLLEGKVSSSCSE